MVVLANQRKDRRRQVTLKRKPGDDPLVHWLVTREQDAHRDFQPGALRTLPRMIESRKFRSLKSISNSRIRNKLNQPYSFQPARMLTRQAVEGGLQMLFSILRQLSLSLILNFYCHYVNTSLTA